MTTLEIITHSVVAGLGAFASTFLPKKVKEILAVVTLWLIGIAFISALFWLFFLK